MRTILERWKRLFVCFQLLVVKFQLTEVSRCCKYYIASAISNCCHSAPYCIRGNGPSSTTYVSGTSHHKDDNNHRATARIFTVTELHIYHKDYSWTIRIRIVQIHDDCHAYCLQLGLMPPLLGKWPQYSILISMWEHRLNSGTYDKLCTVQCDIAIFMANLLLVFACLAHPRPNSKKWVYFKFPQRSSNIGWFEVIIGGRNGLSFRSSSYSG